MKQGQKPWTKEELLLAINLYCKLPFGKLHHRNPEIIALAKLLGRTPGSIAFKLVNFASLDPVLKARGIKGAENTSKLDREIWNEFYNNWDELFVQSDLLMAKRKRVSIEELNEIPVDDLPREGKERERMVKVRLNQNVFRRLVLANYNNQCCITGIDFPELIVASHILPWSADKHNRLNPKNGLALNALHDKAFELGLITISEDYKVLIAPKLHKRKESESIAENFIRFENQPIILPRKFLPDPEFLKRHNERFVA